MLRFKIKHQQYVSGRRGTSRVLRTTDTDKINWGSDSPGPWWRAERRQRPPMDRPEAESFVKMANRRFNRAWHELVEV